MNHKIKQDDSSIKEAYFLENGKLDYERIKTKDKCIQVGYYEEGQLKYEVPIKDDKWHGKFKYWTKEGKLKIESKYLSGKEHGVRKEYYTESGLLFMKKEMFHGKEHGITTTFYENGEQAGKNDYYWHGIPVTFNPKQAKLMADFLANEMNYKIESSNKKIRKLTS